MSFFPPAGDSLAIENERVCVGLIVKPLGIKGELLVKSFTDDPETLVHYKDLELDTGEAIRFQPVGPHKDLWRVRISTVKDRTEAEHLAKRRLYLPRTCLPQLEEDSFYHIDLIGLKAHTLQDDYLGEVCAVHNFGANDILEIRPPSGPTFQIPFTKSYVPTVNLQKNILLVEETSLQQLLPPHQKEEKR